MLAGALISDGLPPLMKYLDKNNMRTTEMNLFLDCVRSFGSRWLLVIAISRVVSGFVQLMFTFLGFSSSMC
jgi:hypothetical protein